MRGKYVVFKDGHRELPIIFPGSLQHFDVARELKQWLGEPISAGQVDCQPDMRPQAFGGSSTLNLESRPEDTNLVRQVLEEDYSYYEDIARERSAKISQKEK